MRLTDHTDYSLRVLMYLNQTKVPTTLNELSLKLGVSRNNLIKVSNRLAKSGWIETSRGRAGGIGIRETAGNLTLKEIVSETEESFNIAECFSDPQCGCSFIKNCSLQRSLRTALNAFLTSLGETTLNDVTPKSIVTNLRSTGRK